MTDVDSDSNKQNGQKDDQKELRVGAKSVLPVMPCHPAGSGDVRATGEEVAPPSTPACGQARRIRAKDESRFANPKPESRRMSVKKFFRCTREDSAVIEGNAASAGLESSSYMRIQCIGKSRVRQHRRIRADWDELRRLMGAANRIGNLINQLVKHLYMGGIPTNCADAALRELHKVVQAISRALDKD